MMYNEESEDSGFCTLLHGLSCIILPHSLRDWLQKLRDVGVNYANFFHVSLGICQFWKSINPIRPVDLAHKSF